MNKKVIALAVAGALFAPLAMAQSSNPVTLYGLVELNFRNVKASGTNGFPARNEIVDEASRLGVRGTEDLGGGLKAFFQLETAFKADQTGGAFANRNSAVGLQGGFGSFLLGRWDTPFKTYSLPADPWGDVNAGGQTGITKDQGNFDRRESNAIQYWLPNISGFTGRLHYSANEGKGGPVNPYTIAGNLSYEAGPVYVGVAYERHNEQNRAQILTPPATPAAIAAVDGRKETGIGIAPAVTFGPVKISGIFEQFKYTAPGLDLKKAKEFMVSGQFTAGPSRFVLSGGQSKNGFGVPDAKSNLVALGYFYSLSKRTTFSTAIAQVKNNDKSNRGKFGNVDALPAVGLGADPREFTIGFKHTF